MKYNKLAILGILGLVGAVAHANGPELIFNGSFEMNDLTGGQTSPFDPSGFDNLTTGSTDITGWTVGGDMTMGDSASSIDYIGPGLNSPAYWNAADGVYSIDLAGITNGSIYQNVSLVAGQEYELTFDLAGNPAGPPTQKEELTTVGGYNQTFLFDTSSTSRSDMGWTLETVYFTASTTESTQLTFASDDSNDSSFGPALDNVSLTATPGPVAALPMALGLLRGRRLRLRKKPAA